MMTIQDKKPSGCIWSLAMNYGIGTFDLLYIVLLGLTISLALREILAVVDGRVLLLEICFELGTRRVLAVRLSC